MRINATLKKSNFGDGRKVKPNSSDDEFEIDWQACVIIKFLKHYLFCSLKKLIIKTG